MNKFLTVSAIIATLAATDASAAQRDFPNWYLGLSAGLNAQTDSSVDGSNTDINWDTGFSGSVSLGYQPPSFGGFRTELEYAHHGSGYSFQGDDGDIRVNTFAGNLYYDFYNSSQFTPYIGGGLGYGNFSISGSSLDDNDGQTIYQAMAGIGYDPQTIKNVTLSLGYRYMAPFADPDSGNGDYEYDNHSLEVGAKFRF